LEERRKWRFGLSYTYGQEVNTGLAEFTPEVFIGYPQAGSFMATLGKTSGTVPANTAQVEFTLVAEVQWNLQPITTPAGWELDPGSTPTNIRFTLTQDWTNASEQNPAWIIPVTSKASRSDQSLAIKSEIQKSGGTWSISAGSTSIFVNVEDNALPVALISSTASAEGNTALLKWATIRETKSKQFDVEHSLNGLNWNRIGSVASQGESSQLLYYTYIHKEPSDGENLYRLKMIDQDKTYSYSTIRGVRLTSISENIMFPNPASTQIKLGVKNLESLTSVKIYDILGREMYNVSGKHITSEIDLEKFNSGSYIIELTGMSGKSNAVKFVVAR
jgi:hypothetical protein